MRGVAMRRLLHWLAILAWGWSTLGQQPLVSSNNYIRGSLIRLNDNGAWSWFMDERAIVDRDQLIVGSVRANGAFDDAGKPGWGNIELSVLNLTTRQVRTVVLHPGFEQDDHNAPGLFVLPDGHYLAAYTKHGQEAKIYFRTSLRPGDPFEWGPVREFETPGNAGNFRRDSVTYCNPIRLSEEGGRIYLLHRGVGLNPNYLVSDDNGGSWRYGGRILAGRGGYSPYLKYASNGRDVIHLVCTEDHPRNYDNSLYHAFIRGGNVHASDGKILAPLSVTTNTSLHAWDLTRIYQGGPSNVAWMCDLELDARERPVALFTVQRDGAGLPTGAGGLDHRFHYAWWDGNKWREHEIAFAGTRLYAGEDDYTGLGAIDPQDVTVVFLSTDADPGTGRPLISKATYRRQHELYRGRSRDGGVTWEWAAVTANSSKDNLRPIVPHWQNDRRALVWMRGDYLLNRGEWTTEIVTCLLPGTWPGEVQ